MRGKKIYHENTNQKKAVVSILHQTKSILEQKILPGIKKIIIMIKCSIHQEDVTILKVYLTTELQNT